MSENKWKVVNLSQQTLINEVCEVRFSSGYALARHIGEEGYIEIISTNNKDKDLGLCYLTVRPCSETKDGGFEWWEDDCARHLYHMSELEEIDPIGDRMRSSFLTWLSSVKKLRRHCNHG